MPTPRSTRPPDSDVSINLRTFDADLNDAPATFRRIVDAFADAG